MFSVRKFILSWSALILWGLPAAAANEVLRVGAILPLSGDNMQWGESTRNGITLALESLLHEQRKRIEVFFEDDQMQSAKSISAYQKLRAVNGIRALINLSSGTGKALAPLAERDQMPFISIASDPAISQLKRFVFILWVTPEEEVRVMLEEIRRRGYRRIGRATSIHDGGFAVRSAFDSLNHQTVSIVAEVEVPFGEKDLRSYALRLKSAGKFDAVFPLILPGSVGLFTRELRRAGYTGPFFGLETFEDQNDVRVSDGALIGAWFVTGSAGEPSWVERYQKRFPQSMLVAAANAHDALMLLCEATKGRDTTQAAEFLRTVHDFKGALGTYSSSGDNRFTVPAVLKVVTADGFVPLEMSAKR